jgi:hypothetical protein
MSVQQFHLVAYGSLNMPESDGPIIGGAIDFTTRISFSDVSPQGTVDAVSTSASDTGISATWTGRSPAADPITETFTLTGQTPVTGSLTFERLLSGTVGLTALGDVAIYAHNAVAANHTAQTGSANSTPTTPALMKLQSGDGAIVQVGHIIRTKSGTGPNQLNMVVATTGFGTDVVAVMKDWAAIPANDTGYDIVEGYMFERTPNQVRTIKRVLATCSADSPGGVSRDFYEKVFYVNNHPSLSLLNSQIILGSATPALPAGITLNFALATALNDASTSTNRQTAPAGGSVTGFGTSISVPQTNGRLPGGAAPNAAGAQAVWLHANLAAGAPAFKGSVDLQCTGNSG